MEEIYEQIGSYMTTCIDNKETLDLMIKELMPLIKQVNYAALDAGSLKEYSDQLGFGEQALTILSNIVSIYRLNSGKGASFVLTACGINQQVIKAVEENLNYIWIPAGLLLIGSGVLMHLREAMNGESKRSNPDRT